MGTGRAAERERFVRDFLRFHGARLEGGPRGPFTAELPPVLSRRLGGTKSLICAFRVGDLASRPGAVLMVPGNPLFDRMLRLARRAGGVSRRYVKRSRTLEPEGRLPETGPLSRAEFGAPVYRPRLLFTFRIAYRAFEGFDDIRSIMVEVPSGRAVDGRDFFRALNLADEPEPDIEPAASVDVAFMLRAALVDLERRIHPTVKRFAQRAEVQLAQEADLLNQFYVALIAEEKTRLKRRGVPEAVAAAEQKVDWVKKVDRETRLFAPRVTVSVLGLEEVWVPVAPLLLPEPANGASLEEKGSAASLVEAELDLSTGELVGLACQVCGAESREPDLCAGHHLVCGECIQTCERCRTSFCLLCLRAPAIAGAEGLCYDPAARDWHASAVCPICSGVEVRS